MSKIIKKIVLYPVSCLIWIGVKIMYSKGSLTFNQVKHLVTKDLGGVLLRLKLKKSGLPTMDKEDFKKYKKSDTLFIFGSGFSINDLTDSEWKDIYEHDSLAMNYSFIEDKIKPTYAYIEVPANPEYYNLIKENLNKNKNYRNVPYIFQYANLIYHVGAQSKFFLELQEKIKNVHVQMPYYHSIPNKNILSDFLKYRDRSTKIVPYDVDTLVHHFGSLSMIINLAYILGYKEIVLMGIDMKDSRYFYQHERFDKNEAALSMRKHIPKNSDKIPHGNIKRTSYTIGFIPGDEYVNVFNDSVLKPNGVKLYIGSKKAKLYPDLPYYFEKTKI